MKINYVTVASDLLASFRYHIKTPAIELKRLGHEVNITGQPLPNQDAYIFHKHLREEERAMIQEVKKLSKKCKTYYIVCDYHLDNKHAAHYRSMIKNCDQLVVCTEAMRKILQKNTGKDSVVIKDPWGIEYQEQEPSYNKHEKLNILWFGSKTNINGLIDELDAMIHHNVIALSDLESGKYEINGKMLRVISFSTDRLIDQMRKADVVVIPQDTKSIGKYVKTHNRVVDSIRAGRFVIASPIDSYKEFSKFAWIGDIKDGFKWLESQSKETIEDMISAGQEYIRKEFAPSVIGKQWESLLSGSARST